LSGQVCGLNIEGGHFVFTATFSWRRREIRSKRRSRNRGVVRGTAFMVREEKQNFLLWKFADVARSSFW
jgi:hypothetical protein